MAWRAHVPYQPPREPRKPAEPEDSEGIDRDTAIGMIVAGVILLCLSAFAIALNWLFGAVIILAPPMIVLGIAGVIDPRIAQAGLKWSGKKVDELPPGIKWTGRLCLLVPMLPALVFVIYMLVVHG